MTGILYAAALKADIRCRAPFATDPAGARRLTSGEIRQLYIQTTDDVDVPESRGANPDPTKYQSLPGWISASSTGARTSGAPWTRSWRSRPAGRRGHRAPLVPAGRPRPDADGSICAARSGGAPTATRAPTWSSSGPRASSPRTPSSRSSTSAPSRRDLGITLPVEREQPADRQPAHAPARRGRQPVPRDLPAAGRHALGRPRRTTA